MAVNPKGRRTRRRARPRPRRESVEKNPLAAALERIAEDLNALGQGHALIGGLAVSAVAEPRLTRDIDLAVAPRTDAEAEEMIRRLAETGYRVLMVVEQTRKGRLATVRLEAPAAPGIIVDLLFASSGIESEIVRAARELELDTGVKLPVASVGHLIALKLLARDDRRRPQDADDLRALLAIATSHELQRAETALRLIMKRGFNRGRKLLEDWKRLLR